MSASRNLPPRFIWAGLLLLLAAAAVAPGQAAAQVASPTPPTTRVEAFEDVNVRAGPGMDYDLVGVMIRGQIAAIYGRSPDSFWVKVEYIGGPDNTGWVFRDLVRIVGDLPSLSTIVPPPTPTLPPTNTPGGPVVDGGTPTPNPANLRPPTFTPPGPVVRPTLLPPDGAGLQAGGFPPALVLIALFALSLFSALVSWLGRRG